jgi:hypothetical protein
MMAEFQRFVESFNSQNFLFLARVVPTAKRSGREKWNVPVSSVKK